jgi:FKBP-type peptidyl-prolyl cis-trans isomerase FkpA
MLKLFDLNKVINFKGVNMKRILNTTLLLSFTLSLSSCAATNKQAPKDEGKMTAKAINETDSFLNENSTREGVNVTSSGLQYMVLTEGNGPKPKATDTVKVHYRGTLTDGKEFDSSYKRGQPISFPLNGVIPGWTEGVQLMSVGSKYRFFIPSRLAYGDRGIKDELGNAIIPEKATLIFEVELLGIE